MAIVHRVLGNCPGCGGKSCFGNVNIGGNTLVRGCGKCRYLTRIPLPPVAKKIVYLDQSLLSSAFKGRDQRAVHAVERVSELASRQLLVAPHSNIHEDETHQWTGYDGKKPAELMRFIEHTGRGLEFKATYEVEHTQAYNGFKAYLEGAAPAYELSQDDAISSSDANEWHNYVYIRGGRYRGDVELIKQLKHQAVQTLVNIFDQWTQSKTSFEEDVRLEVADAGRNYIREYLKYIKRIGNGDYMAMLDAPIVSQCVQTLLHALPKDTAPEDSLIAINSYFASQHFAELPCEWLSSRIFATLKAMVRDGAFANRDKAVEKLGGIFYDVKHIATYAPYSDAIFVDNQMASLVGNPRVGLTDRFGTKVFSLNTLDGFMAWLDSVDAEMTPEHAEALERAYGSRL